MLLRRLHAIVLADKQGHWNLACLLEEVPTEKSPDMHEVIVKDLVKLNQLIDQAEQGTEAKLPDDDE